jgi:hypothetical protein
MSLPTTTWSTPQTILIDPASEVIPTPSTSSSPIPDDTAPRDNNRRLPKAPAKKNRHVNHSLNTADDEPGSSENFAEKAGQPCRSGRKA